MIVEPLTLEEFYSRYGVWDDVEPLCHFTPPVDTRIVLTLLRAIRPKRILEIGTAFGHMTANLANWSRADATVVSLGTVRELEIPVPDCQHSEVPSRRHFGQFANQFGNVQKVLFAVADSATYDFQRIAPIDFAFIDGAHDHRHVRSDTQAVYGVLSPGGVIVWHDYGNAAVGDDIAAVVAEADYPGRAIHVLNTWVAYFIREDDACKGH